MNTLAGPGPAKYVLESLHYRVALKFRTQGHSTSIVGLGAANQLSTNANRLNMLKMAVHSTNQANAPANAPTKAKVTLPSQAAQWRDSSANHASSNSPPRILRVTNASISSRASSAVSYTHLTLPTIYSV